MNYGELKAQVQAYLHRNDVGTISQIPGFITIAASRISTVLRAPENEAAATLAGVVNPQALPDDYAQMSAIQTQADRGPRPLELLNAPNMARVQRRTDAGGGARWFHITGTDLTVWPFTVNDGVGPEIDITYWIQLAALVDDADTNPVLTRWPQLYLYGALIEAYLFTGSPSARATTLETFTGEIDIINAKAGRAKWATAPSVQAG